MGPTLWNYLYNAVSVVSFTTISTYCYDDYYSKRARGENTYQIDVIEHFV